MVSRATELKYERRIFHKYSEHFLAVSGMDFYHDRVFYKYKSDVIYFLEVGVSGRFNGEHWKSLSCVLHIHYKNFPKRKNPPVHDSGNPIPTYWHSRLRFKQERNIEQSEIIVIPTNPSLNPEKYFRSIWHVLDDESNLLEVLTDMAEVIRDTGLPFVEKPMYSREAMLAFDKQNSG